MSPFTEKSTNKVALLLLAIVVGILAFRLIPHFASNPVAVAAPRDPSPPVPASGNRSADIAPVAGGPSRSRPPFDPRDVPSAAQIQQRQDELMREREAKFLAEPLDAAWAAPTEREIAKSLSTESMAAFGAVAPTTSSTSCRSRSCRIEVGYPDEDAAQLSNQVMLGAIADRLSGATLFAQNEPDGSQRLVIYATNPPGPR